jgi:hypothetical protein
MFQSTKNMGYCYLLFSTNNGPEPKCPIGDGVIAHWVKTPGEKCKIGAIVNKKTIHSGYKKCKQ